MSESASSHDGSETGDRAEQRTDAVPVPDESLDDTALHPADDDAIPGKDPEDNPDKEGEDRFDAG